MDQKQFEIQKNIRDNCEDLKNTLNDLYKWEKDIKQKEKEQREELPNNEINVPIIRSHIEPSDVPKTEKTMKGTAESVQNDKPSKDTPASSPTCSEPSQKELANISKEKGNTLVKLGQHEEAIYHYTSAIIHYGSDPIFYTNRALCYLRLEKFSECIEDCNTAIQIDPKSVKAFYRRMQAYESLGEVDKSLADCNIVLTLDPGNLDAKRSQDRIKKRKNSFSYNLSRSFQNIRDGSKVLEPTWTQIDGYMKEIPVTTKPPHLRSKKPIKRIPVEEVLTDDTHLNDIPNEIIDKLFNSNDCGSYKQVEPKQKEETKSSPEKIENNKKENNEKELLIEKEDPPVRKKETIIMPKQRKVEKIPDEPKTQAEFYSTWKELTKEQKYLYLKQIQPKNILKVLGAGFEIDTLSEILEILSEFYIADKCDFRVLFEISKHDEMSILSMFLSEKDNQAFKKIVEYLRQNGCAETKINVLNAKFGVRF